MKPSLLPLLRCPACGDSLSVTAWQSDGEELLEGMLNCPCGETFPVIHGVPRMLLGPLRQQIHDTYPDFFAAHQETSTRSQAPPGNALPGGSASASSPDLPSPISHLPDFSPHLPDFSPDLPSPNSDLRSLRETQASFGYEWTTFCEMRPEWERNFWGYMAPLDGEFFRGKTVLDAGCGMGRHLYYSAHHAETAIGVDFSCAVDSAYGNTRHLPAAHVVQADLRQLPFAPQSFDFVYCLGVLHHLPSPDDGLRSLLGQLQPGGDLRIYVYWSLDQAPFWKRQMLRAVTAARRVTTHMPHRLLSLVCYPITIAAWAAIVVPYKCLSKLSATHNLAESLPLTQYADYSFKTLLNDQFDRFSAPIETRYRESEVRSWLAGAGLQDVTVSAHWGWLGHGKKKAGKARRSEMGDRRWEDKVRVES